MRTIKDGSTITILLLAFLVMVGCKEDRVYKIGVSQCSQDDWRSKMNDEIEREAMFHEDVKVEIRSANDDNARQVEDIRYFVDNGFDIVIVSPNEAAELTPAIKDVYEKGMPVIIFDRNIIGDTYTARIGVDDEGLGRSAAHYALHLGGSGMKAIEIYGLRGSTPAEDRHKGFAEEFIAGGGKLLASEEANWNKEDAVPVVDSLLRIYNDVDLIFAHNDRMAIGASEVADSLGRDGIRIIGIDAAPNIGIQAVADSVIDATFLYPTEGHRLIRTALAILRGEPYDKEKILPVSSAVDSSNADILLLQNETLKDETGKMRLLKARIDDYWARHSSQTSLFYASIVIIVLLLCVCFLVLRAFWQHKRHQSALVEQNRMLEEERDKQETLNKKLQEATQSKLVFFTNVSHDLRTPLTLISVPVSQLAASENLTPQQRTLVRIADKNVRILQRLINQILDFRKYENDKLTLRLVEMDFGKAVEEWMESFYEIAKEHDIRLSLHEPEEKGIVLALDAEKMERVFFNLVSNAFKYTPSNGSITVGYGIERGCLVFSVSDTGEGISERDLGNIFDRFFQVDQVHPKGSGIGLSLTKAFVEMHGGRITVDSKLGKGSVFTVELPIRHVSDTPQEVEKQYNSTDVLAELGEIESKNVLDSDKPLVLVVDDNIDIQKLACELLRDSYNVMTALNGADGIKKAVKYVPDLIICDVMMPVMDGLECCRRLKEEMVTSHIPVLMLTSCSMDEQRVQGYESGADGYLSKPFSTKVLLSRCASLISNRKRIKELWTGRMSEEEPRKPLDKQLSDSVGAVDIDNEFYRRFLDIFTSDIGNVDVSVDSIASKMGLERTQFYRKIKAITNYSPVELMRSLRLKHARNLITSTEKNISEIAYDAGFSTPAYFTKCYREAYGETPTETRTRLGGRGS
ncbi:MAG: substrate-binding domain-containing protein [Muribaculaceae bacterium]|nr:substrate-binding domain-containing protein [Muribaculaceae bacterium]